MAKITIGCKLPSGIVLQLRRGDGKGKNDGYLRADRHGQTVVTGAEWDETKEATQVLNGTNASRVIGGYGFTEVDAGFWERWKAQHASWFKPYTSGAIFEAGETSIHDVDTLQAKVDDRETPAGFDPLPAGQNGNQIDPEKAGTRRIHSDAALERRAS